MNGIPSYYKADDLLVQALCEEGRRICAEKIVTEEPVSDYPADSFEQENESSKLKKGLTIGGVIAGVTALAFGIYKFVKKGELPPINKFIEECKVPPTV